MKRLLLIIIILIVCLAGIFVGAKKGDLIVTENAGSYICLSCMGLQK